MAGEVSGALAEAHIASLLIKGPAVVRWLYNDDPESRGYRDLDLAVSPRDFERAEDVLRARGFTCAVDGLNAREKAWLMETPWERSGSAAVDLHRGFHGVGDWDAWWSMLDRHAMPLAVTGRPVRIPDPAACALVVTLHDSAVDRNAQSAEDVRRALSTFGQDVWEEAARRAAAVDAVASFVLGLSHHEQGRRLAVTLGLPARLPLDVAARSGAGPGADPLRLGRAWVVAHRLGRADGWGQRLSVLWGLAFPSAGALRISSPFARRGPVALTLMRVLRPLELAVRAPAVIYQLWRGYRGSRSS